MILTSLTSELLLNEDAHQKYGVGVVVVEGETANDELCESLSVEVFITIQIIRPVFVQYSTTSSFCYL